MLLDLSDRTRTGIFFIIFLLKNEEKIHKKNNRPENSFFLCKPNGHVEHSWLLSILYLIV